MTTNTRRARLVLYHTLLLGGVFLFWYAMTEPGLIPPFWFDDPTRAKFFFGQPLKVFQRIWTWFSSGSIYLHLGVTLIETLLAFAIGTLLGLVAGLWLALSPTAGRHGAAAAGRTRPACGRWRAQPGSLP